MKKQWEKIFFNYISDRKLRSKIYVEFNKLNNKRTNKLINIALIAFSA